MLNKRDSTRMFDTGDGMSNAPFIVADTLCRTGEGPIWRESDGMVYWVDIPAGTLYRYDPHARTHEEVLRVDGTIGGYTFQADGSLLLFGDNGSIRRAMDGELSTIIAEIPRERGGRFNDVIADPEGRVYCGTMPIGDQPGRLYRLELDGSLHVAFDDAGLSNGMGFSPDLLHFYHADSLNRRITRSRYDRTTGELSDRSIFHRTRVGDGVPDGMSVDAEGAVWVAQWDGHSLIRLGSDGTETERVMFPPKKVSSLTFGGTGYRTAWVTTANPGGREIEGPGAGALFEVDLGVAGRPEFLSRIGL
jgi:D-xylono/L-arabinono-1,4-lactonase